MYKKAFILLLCGLFISAFGFFAGALPPEVEHSLHDVKILTLKTSSDLSEIWDLRDVPDKYDIVKLTKLDLDNFSTAQLDTLKNWVQDGGTLWCDPARRKVLNEFNIEVAKWDEGWNVVDAAGYHQILRAVKKVKLYLIGDFINGIDVPLLYYENKLVGGISFFGRGMVIAVNSWDIKKDYKDGERFLANVKEFGAGYQVPPADKNVPETNYDRIKLLNQETLTGDIKPEVLVFETPYGRFNFYQSEIDSLRFKERTILELKRGDRLIGQLKLIEIEIRLRNGQWRTIQKRDVSSILFAQ